ncbi:hypothetical protein PSHT_11384 [Puccinia striiformis]|uniref:Uncharacterized protein n=1 Tax=Puccinia striiformis TaxID=27350 RepID=A0A2S4V3P2_9BASI|nr:hypothetical protein PSHT_11384 [Puccinia striiformis]
MAIMIPAYWPKSTLTRSAVQRCQGSRFHMWQMKSQCISSNEQIRPARPRISAHQSTNAVLVSKQCQWGSESGDRVVVGHLISSHLLPVGFGVGKPSRSGVVLLSMT